jgi:hypothetical protein
VNAYFYDLTGQKALAVKAHHLGMCRGCGAYTQPGNGNGNGDRTRTASAVTPARSSRRWTRELVLAAMLE